MTSERRRHQLYEEAKKVFSQESADELMSYLPPVGWADVATKTDLSMIRHEMDALRAEMRGEMSELRGEMAAMRGEWRAELTIGMDRMRAWTITTMIALTGVNAALMLGLVQLTR